MTKKQTAAHIRSIETNGELFNDDEEAVCRRLRALRTEKGLTLEALAALSGFTKGYLSRIENGGKAPPIASLAKIARALGQELSCFFVDDVTSTSARLDESRVSVVHKWERKPVTRGGSAFGYDYVSLAHKRANKLMEPFAFTFPASGDVDQFFQHAGEEFIYVLSGKVAFEVMLGDAKRTYTLEAGDSIYFDSSLPHRGYSLEGEAQAMVVMQGAAEGEVGEH
ncbi:Cro/Cl family transcriptional regulator [Pandoraea capi]|uniref:Cro/Cl family transcriptional regulator n=1 Tax=Pandoraea capi TaxID=2508286 RepID=A0ABY6WAA0_9BURK|nr:XRE family transcriptional regulator [Pandoraea capi]VVE45742.1 Cro/Cl family transcriptional regulator [Pandoraea capi]